MRKSLASPLLLLAFPCALAQKPPSPPAPPAGSNWARVQALPVGTSLHINGKPHTTCVFASADVDSISCTKSGKTQTVTYPRDGITSIKLTRRSRSTLVGLGIGAGAGAIVGFAGATDSTPGLFGPHAFRGSFTAIGAVVGGLIGTPIGYFTDFTAGSPIYKAN